MNERLAESLSALMDNEADELEIARVLAQVADDGELRAAWLRYNLVRHGLQGGPLAHADRDISERVRTAVAGQGQAPVAGGLRQRLWRPLTSLAVAASVAATVVIGGQQLAQVGGADGAHTGQAVARIPLAPGIAYSQGAMPVPASYGWQAVPVLQPATRNAYNDLAQRRSNRYMWEHAEQAALNSPAGLLPFARVPEIIE